MQEMDRRLALLRLLLADITARERQAEAALAQLRTQLTRIVEFTVQYNGGVVNALASMAEVEERLAAQEMALRHLGLLRQRARGELEALIVTREVGDARKRLDELEVKRAALLGHGERGELAGHELAQVDAEIAELRATIEAASDAAARALARRPDEPPARATEGKREERGGA
jgi:chromosome segregation ATPase